MTTTTTTLLLGTFILTTITACGGRGGYGDDDDVVAADGDADTDADADSDADGDPGPDGAPLTVRIVATTAAFPHDDGLTGQTALHASGGVRSLQLLHDEDDAAPVSIFDHGAAVIEAGYDDGDDTIVARVEIPADLRGTYTRARLVQGYSRYQVEALLHDGLTTEPGVVDSVLVMSDDTRLDGTVRNAGHFDFRFEGDATTFAYDGVGWPVPPYSTTAGATAIVEDGEWAVYFPIDLQVPDGVAPGSELVITVNMDHSFRWTDLLALGYESDVFDVTRLSYEPVLRFGGNSFELDLAER